MSLKALTVYAGEVLHMGFTVRWLADQSVGAHRKHGFHGCWVCRVAVCPAGHGLGRVVKVAAVILLGP